jgi:endonuclease YncB( thermonuclease family)
MNSIHLPRLHGLRFGISINIIAIFVIAISLSIGIVYAYPQRGAPIAGVVTKIVDGDTIDAKLTNNETVRIRLTLSNTPERGEAGWLSATTFTKVMCPVGTAIIMDPDAGQPKSYNRNVAKVFCLHLFLQNEELLRGRYAVVNQSRWCHLTEFAKEPWSTCPTP